MEPNYAEIMMKKMKKDIVINRVFSIITMVMTLAILILVIIGFVRVNNFLTEAEVVIEELSKIDMEALNESLENFNDIMETFHFDEIKEKLDSINFDGINQILEGLDVDELTETLENINEGADRLDQVTEWFQNSPFNIFGGSQ
ncbi:MAG: hypothetical protein IJZ42_03695 [Lachnospiraceae bacterium]|nr:hypothetical protein [Lachnospiraceae bacterium]